MGITAYHPMAQPGPQQSECLALKIDNPCVEADCQGMCILSKDSGGFGVGYRCACPIGQVQINPYNIQEVNLLRGNNALFFLKSHI